MTQDLLRYYNEELDYVRRAGASFAKAHPKIAGALRMDQNNSDDPLVSRLIESFAFLTAKLNKQLEGDNVELAQTLLNLLYPHVLLPTPSLTMVQLNPGENLRSVVHYQKGTALSANTEQNERCQFQTCFPLDVAPLAVSQATLSRATDLPLHHKNHRATKACVRIGIHTTHKEVALTSLDLSTLRFYIHSQKQYANRLYEMVFNHIVEIKLYDTQSKQLFSLSEVELKPVGFEKDTSLFPFPSTSFDGFRLITEYSVFPEKFMFFDLTQITSLLEKVSSDQFEIWLCLDQAFSDLEMAIDQNTFALGVTPAVNLFEMQSDAIHVNHKQSSYRINIDQRQTPEYLEVYQVCGLTGWQQSGSMLDFKPLYGLKYGEKKQDNSVFWDLRYKPAWMYGEKNRVGNEVELRFVDYEPDVISQAWSVTASLLCTNRRLASELPFGGDQPKFTLHHEKSSQVIARCLRQPTVPIEPKLTNQQYWQVIASLVSAHQGLIDDDAGVSGLQAVLSNLNTAQSQELTLILQSMQSLRAQYVTTRFPNAKRLTFVRGTKLTLTFDSKHQHTSDLYLFGSVLSRFLNQYCALDSFIELAFELKHEGEIAKWKPQFGQQPHL